MTADDHKFFTIAIKQFTVFKKLSEDTAGGLNSLEQQLVHWENKLVSLEAECKEKQIELVKIEKEIKERNHSADSGMVGLRESLNKKHLDLIKRERDLELKERQVKEKLDRADNLVTVAERSGKREKVAA